MSEEKHPAERLKFGSYKYPPKFSCRHRNCIYGDIRNGTSSAVIGRCNYMGVTGHSRIAQLEGEARLPYNCPFYTPGARKKRQRKKKEEQKDD